MSLGVSLVINLDFAVFFNYLFLSRLIYLLLEVIVCYVLFSGISRS